MLPDVIRQVADDDPALEPERMRRSLLCWDDRGGRTHTRDYLLDKARPPRPPRWRQGFGLRAGLNP
jgi:hypothetical protein